MWLLENGWLFGLLMHCIQSELPVGDELVYRWVIGGWFTAEGVVTLSREELMSWRSSDSYKLTVLSHRGQWVRMLYGTSSIYSTLVMGGRDEDFCGDVSSLFDSKKAFLDMGFCCETINYRKINTSVPSHSAGCNYAMHFTRSEGDEYARINMVRALDAQLTSLADALLRDTVAPDAIVLCLDHGYMLEVPSTLQDERRLYYRIFEVFSRILDRTWLEDRKALSLLNDIDHHYTLA
ncbi:hypothetical protein SPFM15_00175 [Salmonella phage SPFM15]|nr:hypothetical protein SPFM5_00170 [Salmonella phage SPFM5]VFR13799.1 hypothetical protein SPFM15_00175 [Salmonella phage SPFM15]